MATKTTGIELKAFYDDRKFWPDGTYHEDECITVDGVLMRDEDDIMKIGDAARVVVEGGVVIDLPDVHPDSAPSFEGHFKRWRKAQTTSRAAFECPKEKLDAVIEAIVAAGGKVEGGRPRT